MSDRKRTSSQSLRRGDLEKIDMRPDGWELVKSRCYGEGAPKTVEPSTGFFPLGKPIRNVANDVLAAGLHGLV
jgi:hypothetical protein